MDLPAADVPRRPAAHRQPPGPQARPQDPQEHARQARDEVNRVARWQNRIVPGWRARGPFGLEELWYHYVALQNLIPSFPWITPGWRDQQEGITFYHMVTLFQMRERRVRMRGRGQAGPDVRPPQGVRLQPQEAGVLLQRMRSHRPQG